jgi:non-specific serine/threonine protein kinase
VKDLSARLDERLPLLTSRRRDIEQRQRTLAATIAWSYDLLDDDEKKLFRRLSVFARSFEVVAAEDVCAADLDVLESLVDKSLLRRTRDGRLSMLETIHEFAASVLASDKDERKVAAAHALYFLRFAEDAEPHLDGGPEQAEWFARLERELDNLRTALSFFRDHREHRLEFRTAVAIREFWWMHGYVHEGRSQLRHAVENAGIPVTRVGLKALEGVAYFAYLEGDEDDARVWADRLLKLAEELGDDLSLAHAWQTQALLERDDEERVRLAKRVIELAGDDPFARHAIEALGLIAVEHGEFDAARHYFERALQIGEAIDDRNMVIGVLVLLAVVAVELADYEEAISRLRAGTEEAQRIGDKTLFIWERAWVVAALVLAARGSFADAFRVLGAAERLREDRGDRIGGFTEEFNRRAVAKIRADSSADEAEREWQEGRRLASTAYLVDMLARLD